MAGYIGSQRSVVLADVTAGSIVPSDLDRSYLETSVGSGNLSTLGIDNHENIIVDASGRVTMPYQPYFFVHGKTYINDVVFANNTVSYNDGSHYDNTTGRFNAPISGTYLIVHMHTTETPSSHFIDIYVNGALFGGFHPLGYDNYADTVTNVQIIKLEAGDYVEARRRSSDMNTPYGVSFSGRLLG